MLVDEKTIWVSSLFAFVLSVSLNLGVQGWTGDWDCVAAVDRLPALHYSEDFIFLSFGIIGFIVEL